MQIQHFFFLSETSFHETGMISIKIYVEVA